MTRTYSWQERQAMDREQQAETERAIEGLEKRRAAARAMLAALKHTADWIAMTQPATTFAPRDMLRAAIAQAEAAGITTGEK
jgi:hypothetical protein